MVNYAVAPSLHFNLGDIVPLQKKSVEEKETKPAAANPPSPADYIIIADENPFHPERKIPPEKKADEKPLPKPEFVVYGTVISNDTSLAYLEDLKAPVNTSGRGKRQIALKTGDVLSGYTLKTVEADKIVMVRGEEKMVIPVRNTARAKPSVNPSPQKAAAPSATKIVPSPASLIQREPPPKIRAPMTPADEKVRQFFQR
jgi:type II secretory pathway component PulC